MSQLSVPGSTGAVDEIAPIKPIAGGKESPPRAPLAFRVGVVGHRPNRLGQADLTQLADVLKDILTTVKIEVSKMRKDTPWLFDDTEPVLRAISPLAEGTDRIFAKVALELDFELCCVMPFVQAEFEKDFAEGSALEPDSLNQFRILIGQAKTRFELDGNRADQDWAYGTAGRTVLNQSDLLVVVWDGERLGKRGGTEDTLDAALRQGVPVVWVDARSPHSWQLVDTISSLTRAPRPSNPASAATDCVESLRKCVRAALQLPKPQSSKTHNSDGTGIARTEDPAHGLRQFYDERQPRWTIAVVWKVFRDLLGDRKRPRVQFRIDPFEESVKNDWPEDTSSAASRIVNRLRPYYAWPDKLAVVYSDRYRSAFVLAFLLAAVAVGMALLPFGLSMESHHLAETLCIVFELLAIVVILGLVLMGRRSHWHERWINYRLAAELVRHLRLVAPLGGGRPFPQIPAHWATYGQPASTWMAWYVRAVERVLGLESATVDKSYLESGLVHLSDLVRGQIEFHEVAAQRCHRIEKRLHFAGISLLLLTLACCGLHLLPNFWTSVHLPGWLPPMLTFFCGFFPALGAALAGIVNQGEFRRIAKRSESMHEQLKILDQEIGRLHERVKKATGPAEEQFSVRAAELASNATRLLVNEVLDWRVVFLDRPFEHPPG